MDETKLIKSADLLKVIAHPTRLKIILLMAHHGPRNCSSLQHQLDLDQPLLSHHLIKLKDKGVLTCQRKGREIHYSVNASLADSLTRLLSVRVGGIV